MFQNITSSRKFNPLIPQDENSPFWKMPYFESNLHKSPHKKIGQFNFRKNEILTLQKFYAAFAANCSPCCKRSEQSCACPVTFPVVIMDVPLPQRGGMALAWSVICLGFFGSKPEGTTRRNRREGNMHPGVLGHSQAMPHLLPGLPSNVRTKIKIQSIFKTTGHSHS